MSCNDFKEYKLGELVDISSSKRIYANEYSDCGVPFYRGKEIIEKHKGSVISTELYISEERYNELKVKFGVPDEGDILLTSVGTLGVPYLVKNEEFYFKDGNLTWFKKFKSECNNTFIYYWLQSPFAKEQIYNKSIGSTQKALTIDTLKKFDIKLPSLYIQKKVSEILISLNNKIELNNEMNKTLEEMAQALFKRWFVDFEFPNEEGEPYKSSGGEMVDSELGMIPKGWVNTNIEHFCEITSSKRIFMKDYVSEGIPFYRGKEVIQKSLGKQISTELYITKEKFNEIKSKFGIPVKNDILLTSVGTLGISYYVDNEEFYFKDGNLTWFRNFRKSSYNTYVYMFLNSSIGENSLNEITIGSTQKALTISSLKKIKLLCPREDILIKFNDIITSLIEKIRSNNYDSERLIDLRDSLLPKLMSGEIRVEEIEANL